MFKNIEKLFYDIKNQLISSDDFRKLVFYNTSNALSQVTPSKEEVDKYVYIKPVIFVYEDSPENSMSTFVTIGLIESLVEAGNIFASIRISISCNREIWELDNYRVRPLAIASEIGNLLDEAKLGPAGKLELKVVKEVYFNEKQVGYIMLFDIVDEKGDVVDEF